MINDMNKTPKEKWLAEYSKKSTITVYKKNFNDFCIWAKTSDIELVKQYDEVENKRVWRKEMGAVILRWYAYMLKEKGMAINTARSKLNGIRAFLKSQAEAPYIKKGAIAQPQIAVGEHEFTREELKRMFHFGDVREKALLSTAVALGWGAQDFASLKRSFIEPFLQAEPFTGFWYRRKKTGAETRAHLTPEAIDSLKAWLAIAPESEYVWMSNGKTHVTSETVNNQLREIMRKAAIKPRGTVRFHLMRKFLMSQLASAGINQTHVKLLVGKSIPHDILTYLKDVTEQLRTEYMNAYERFALVGYENKNHNRIEQLETIVKEQQH